MIYKDFLVSWSKNAQVAASFSLATPLCGLSGFLKIILILIRAPTVSIVYSKCLKYANILLSCFSKCIDRRTNRKKDFFSMVAESWAICFESETSKTVCFILKTRFYLQFDLISEISTPENARIDTLIISLG